MAAHYLRGNAAASECPKALLLRGEAISPDDEKIAALFEVLRVPWQAVPASEMAGSGEWNASRDGERFCVVGSARCVATLLDSAAKNGSELPAWMSNAESVYVYGFAPDTASESLLRFLTGDQCATIRRATGRETFVTVTSDFPEMCGPMSGLQVQARIGGETVFAVCEGNARLQCIVSSREGPLFVGVQRGGAQFFLNSSPNIVDVSALCTKYFDVRDNFCEAVPLVMYAKWALGPETRPEISGCLIVDDPPLKPRYGFLKYQDALRLMDEHNFATTIAFIPWNWRRTDEQTVQLFHKHPDRFSLCIHGCDHTAKEFAERSPAVLNKRINVANQRMRQFGKRTLLRHDNVMLFPQGAFSAGAARALKLNGFVAAANTEVTPVHKDENKTTVGDLFGLAITKYASFPMFTRRYLAHGVENFAFDGLLGKPCFIAAHHDDFAGDARILLQVIAKLNSLNWKLRWRPLGTAIRRSFGIRRRRGADHCVEMFGSSLIYKNSHSASNRTTFIKEENDFHCVKGVTVNGLPVDFTHDGTRLQFEAIVPPNESAEACVTYSGVHELPSSEDGLNYRAKAILRRYLSEFRDNYLSRNAHLQQGAVRIKEALRL